MDLNGGKETMDDRILDEEIFRTIKFGVCDCDVMCSFLPRMACVGIAGWLVF